MGLGFGTDLGLEWVWDLGFGMEWDGMGWDGMGWDIEWVASIDCMVW